MTRVIPSFETFQRIVHRQQLTLRIIGCDLFDVNFKISATTVCIFFLASLFMTISLIDLYLFRDNIFEFIFVLVTFFYGVIGCGRLGFLLTHSSIASKLLIEAKLTYEQTSHEDCEQKVLIRYTNILKHCAMLFKTVFLGASALTMLLPLIIFFINGSRILPFGVVLPFTDPESVEGYRINYIYQVSCALWTPPGLTASQNMYFALVFNVCIQYDLLILKLRDLDDLINHNDDGMPDADIHQKIIDIIQRQQQLINFVTNIEKLYAKPTLIEVVSNGLQIVMTLFVLHVDFWMPGYFIMIIATFQLLLSCFLGTLIDMKSELFTKEIYNLSWNLMKTSDQKTLKFMLAKSQRSLMLSCGGMMTLNMNLFLNVYKKIYSIFMMLQNM
ncbi:putative odorant receptor 83c [Armigeres subalbatus]|uniref:putative odorant receptor 83c n=1 Tax=Armigeres subalbatus TaxID=124917 RepID=UPI002ED44684